MSPFLAERKYPFVTELRSANPLMTTLLLVGILVGADNLDPTSQNFVLFLLILLWLTSENSADGFSGSADDRMGKSC